KVRGLRIRAVSTIVVEYVVTNLSENATAAACQPQAVAAVAVENAVDPRRRVAAILESPVSAAARVGIKNASMNSDPINTHVQTGRGARRDPTVREQPARAVILDARCGARDQHPVQMGLGRGRARKIDPVGRTANRLDVLCMKLVNAI